MPSDASRRARSELPGQGLVVGLTGAPAAGKSTVARFLREAGCPVIDVDGLGHEALDAPAVREAVQQAFGPGVVGADGRLDRHALARVAFRSPAALRRLEELVHPTVAERLREEVAAALRAGADVVVVDAALLFEGGIDAYCDETIVVHAPRELRLARAESARGWDDGELRRREQSQLSAEEKRSRAARVLVNAGDREALGRATLALYAELRAAATERLT